MLSFCIWIYQSSKLAQINHPELFICEIIRLWNQGVRIDILTPWWNHLLSAKQHVHDYFIHAHTQQSLLTQFQSFLFRFGTFDLFYTWICIDHIDQSRCIYCIPILCCTYSWLQKWKFKELTTLFVTTYARS